MNEMMDLKNKTSHLILDQLRESLTLRCTQLAHNVFQRPS